jgi:hypothetical protein
LIESGVHGILAGAKRVARLRRPPPSRAGVASVDKGTFALDCGSSGDVGSVTLQKDHLQRNAPAKLFGYQRAAQNDCGFR